METVLRGTGIVPVTVLGNFLSGMETGPYIDRRRVIYPLGNFLSGMET